MLKNTFPCKPALAGDRDPVIWEAAHAFALRLEELDPGDRWPVDKFLPVVTRIYYAYLESAGGEEGR